MKKISLFIVTALFLYVITAACKKDSTDIGGKPVATFPKIDSVIDYHYDPSGSSSTFQYDLKGRVFRIKYKYYGFDSLFYSSAQVLRKSYWPDGYPSGTEVYTLNSRGLATLVIDDSKKNNNSFAANLPETFDFNRNTSSSIQLLCEYDANEYLVKKTYYDYFNYGDTITYLYKITNGNISGITGASTDTDIPYSIIETFFYYTDKQNTIGNQNQGIAFLGKQNNNLYKTILYSHVGENIPDTVHYWYKFDHKNRVSMRYTRTNYSSYVDSTRYTYKD